MRVWLCVRVAAMGVAVMAVVVVADEEDGCSRVVVVVVVRLLMPALLLLFWLLAPEELRLEGDACAGVENRREMGDVMR